MIKKHHFYKYINKFNISSHSHIVNKMSYSNDTAIKELSKSDIDNFEDIHLPYSLEEKLSKVDWSANNVLVGSLGSIRQFEDNISRRYYYVPAKNVDIDIFSVQYIALYQSEKLFGNKSGISYYGEICEIKCICRKEIKFPMRKNNGDELYYAFRIKEWKRLYCPISAKDETVFAPRFTNIFLLQQCVQTYELFNIHSSDQYRLLYKLKRIYNDISININSQISTAYKVDKNMYIYVHNNCLYITNENGERLLNHVIKISDFERYPSRYFKIIDDIING